MSDAAPSSSGAMDRLKRDLSSVSATHLAAGMQTVTRTVLSEGAVVITRHDKPSMVLMSVERYLKLEQAAEPQLEALTRKFDDLFARMQGDAAAQAMESAFAMTPERLGKAAAEAAAETAAESAIQAAGRARRGKTSGA